MSKIGGVCGCSSASSLVCSAASGTKSHTRGGSGKDEVCVFVSVCGQLVEHSQVAHNCLLYICARFACICAGERNERIEQLTEDVADMRAIFHAQLDVSVNLLTLWALTKTLCSNWQHGRWCSGCFEQACHAHARDTQALCPGYFIASTHVGLSAADSTATGALLTRCAWIS